MEDSGAICPLCLNSVELSAAHITIDCSGCGETAYHPPCADDYVKSSKGRLNPSAGNRRKDKEKASYRALRGGFWWCPKRFARGGEFSCEGKVNNATLEKAKKQPHVWLERTEPQAAPPKKSKKQDTSSGPRSPRTKDRHEKQEGTSGAGAAELVAGSSALETKDGTAELCPHSGTSSSALAVVEEPAPTQSIKVFNASGVFVAVESKPRIMESKSDRIHSFGGHMYMDDDTISSDVVDDDTEKWERICRRRQPSSYGSKGKGRKSRAVVVEPPTKSFKRRGELRPRSQGQSTGNAHRSKMKGAHLASRRQASAPLEEFDDDEDELFWDYQDWYEAEPTAPEMCIAEEDNPGTSAAEACTAQHDEASLQGTHSGAISWGWGSNDLGAADDAWSAIDSYKQHNDHAGDEGNEASDTSKKKWSDVVVGTPAITEADRTTNQRAHQPAFGCMLEKTEIENRQAIPLEKLRKLHSAVAAESSGASPSTAVSDLAARMHIPSVQCHSTVSMDGRTAGEWSLFPQQPLGTSMAAMGAHGKAADRDTEAATQRGAPSESQQQPFLLHLFAQHQGNASHGSSDSQIDGAKGQVDSNVMPGREGGQHCNVAGETYPLAFESTALQAGGGCIHQQQDSIASMSSAHGYAMGCQTSDGRSQDISLCQQDFQRLSTSQTAAQTNRTGISTGNMPVHLCAGGQPHAAGQRGNFGAVTGPASNPAHYGVASRSHMGNQGMEPEGTQQHMPGTHPPKGTDPHDTENFGAGANAAPCADAVNHVIRHGFYAEAPSGSLMPSGMLTEQEASSLQSQNHAVPQSKGNFNLATTSCPAPTPGGGAALEMPTTYTTPSSNDGGDDGRQPASEQKYPMQRSSTEGGCHLQRQASKQPLRILSKPPLPPKPTPSRLLNPQDTCFSHSAHLRHGSCSSRGASHGLFEEDTIYQNLLSPPSTSGVGVVPPKPYTIRWSGGECPFKERCCWAHSAAELRVPVMIHELGLLPGDYKTQLCEEYGQFGTCQKGPLCLFAHGFRSDMRREASVRLGVRDPNFKTMICPRILQGLRCDFGGACNYAHSAEDMRVAECIRMQYMSHLKKTGHRIQVLLKAKPCPRDCPEHRYSATISECPFYHCDLDRLDPVPYTLELCPNWLEGEVCTYHNDHGACPFSHGYNELKMSERIFKGMARWVLLPTAVGSVSKRAHSYMQYGKLQRCMKLLQQKGCRIGEADRASLLSGGEAVQVEVSTNNTGKSVVSVTEEICKLLKAKRGYTPIDTIEKTAIMYEGDIKLLEEILAVREQVILSAPVVHVTSN